MLTVHHLGISQSERILWLLEELSVPYKLIKYTRDPLLAPESLKSLPGNETGTSPFVEDDETGAKMNESGAICEYIIYKYGQGRLAAKPSDKNYFDYLYWFHYSNASLQPAMGASMFITLAGVSSDNQMMQFGQQRLKAAYQHVDKRLSSNKFLAGSELTAADIMNVYVLTTQRYWGPQTDLGPYPNILRWLQDCSNREAYQRAMAAGDPEMKLLLGAAAPETGMFESGGTASDHWKK